MSTHPTDGQQPVNLRPNLAVAPHPEERAPAARLRRSLNRVMRSRRAFRAFFRRAALRALVIEQIIIGGQRDSGTTSYAENLIRAIGKAAGDHVLGKTQQILNQLARKADGLRAEQASLRTRAGYVAGHYVGHPDGGVRTVTDTVGDQDRQRAEIAADIEGGSRRHRRLPKALRRVPLLVFAADALLLLYFFSGVTNVDWGSPFSAALVFAVLLAAMVTGISFAFFRFAGDRLQQYKNDAGTVPLRGLDEATMVTVGLALAAIAVLAVLMFTRMRTEVIIALGSHAGGTAIIIGLTLAMISVLANTLVIAVHALDGSTEADRLDALGAAVAGKLKLACQLPERADILDQAINALGREADREAAKGVTEAGQQRAAADRLIDAARAIHQGTGPLSEPAVDPNSQDGVIGYRRPDANPEVDERPVRLALNHIHIPLAGKQPSAVQEPEDCQDPAAGEERPAA
jgi:hypothetical protein